MEARHLAAAEAIAVLRRVLGAAAPHLPQAALQLHRAVLRRAPRRQRQPPLRLGLRHLRGARPAQLTCCSTDVLLN
jgi:hypothetical protein